MIRLFLLLFLKTCKFVSEFFLEGKEKKEYLLLLFSAVIIKTCYC